MWAMLMLACGDPAAAPAPSTPAIEPIAAAPAPPAPVRPAWSEAEHCTSLGYRDTLSMGRANREGFRTLSKDLDGDGKVDRLFRLSDGGSGGSMAEVRYQPGRGTPITLNWEATFGTMSTEVLQPADASPKALAIVGDALFGTVCTAPDPSLAWLMHPDEPVWYEGSAVMPPFYALAADGRWTTYAGHTQRGLTGDVSYPILLAERGDLQVKATAHGVYVETEGRHSWVYVSAGHAKLRWPSSFSARFVDDHTLEVTRAPTALQEIEAPIVVTRRL